MKQKGGSCRSQGRMVPRKETWQSAGGAVREGGRGGKQEAGVQVWNTSFIPGFVLCDRNTG